MAPVLVRSLHKLILKKVFGAPVLDLKNCDCMAPTEATVKTKEAPETVAELSTQFSVWNAIAIKVERSFCVLLRSN